MLFGLTNSPSTFMLVMTQVLCPKTIASDIQVYRLLLKTFWHMLGSKLKVSTTFHSQTDEQKKVVMRSLGNLFTTFVGEQLGSWDLKLFIVEFGYNASVNWTTGRSLHEIIYGLDPNNLLILFL